MPTSRVHSCSSKVSTRGSTTALQSRYMRSRMLAWLSIAMFDPGADDTTTLADIHKESRAAPSMQDAPLVG